MNAFSPVHPYQKNVFFVFVVFPPYSHKGLRGTHEKKFSCSGNTKVFPPKRGTREHEGHKRILVVFQPKSLVCQRSKHENTKNTTKRIAR